MKDKHIFQSKKFAAFFFSVCAITANLWFCFAVPTMTWQMVTFASLGMFGIVVLCLGYCLPQAKYDRALAVLLKRVEQK